MTTKLTHEEHAALQVTLRAMDTITGGIRRIDWAKTIELSQRLLTHGAAECEEPSPSSKEALRRMMRDAQALISCTAALIASARECRCDGCTERHAAIS